MPAVACVLPCAASPMTVVSAEDGSVRTLLADAAHRAEAAVGTGGDTKEDTGSEGERTGLRGSSERDRMTGDDVTTSSSCACAGGGTEAAGVGAIVQFSSLSMSA